MRTMVMTPTETSHFSVSLHDLVLNSIIFSSTFRPITSHDFPYNQWSKKGSLYAWVSSFISLFMPSMLQAGLLTILQSPRLPSLCDFVQVAPHGHPDIFYHPHLYMIKCGVQHKQCPFLLQTLLLQNHNHVILQHNNIPHKHTIGHFRWNVQIKTINHYTILLPCQPHSSRHYFCWTLYNSAQMMLPPQSLLFLPGFQLTEGGWVE